MQASNEINRMAKIVTSMYAEIIQLIYRFDARSLRKIIEMKSSIDSLHQDLSSFLGLLAKENLDSANSMKLPLLLQLVNQLEHLADINLKLLSGIQKKKMGKIRFSTNAMTELKRLAAAVNEMIEITVSPEDIEMPGSQKIAELKSKVEEIREAAAAGHIKRMKTGHCSLEAGFLYNDMISALDSIAESSSKLIDTWRKLE
jgi:phosphate:Na+ symporter